MPFLFTILNLNLLLDDDIYFRVYYDAGLEESYTSPGEWPWATLIFKDGVYIG